MLLLSVFLSLSHVWLIVTPWTIACQAPLSMEFPGQEYCHGLPFPSPGDLPHPGIEPTSPASPALASGFFTIKPRGKPYKESQLLAIFQGQWRITSSFYWLPGLHGRILMHFIQLLCYYRCRLFLSLSVHFYKQCYSEHSCTHLKILQSALL